jgi:hypothetical protein
MNIEENKELKPSIKTVKEFFKSWRFWKPAIAIVIGGLAGFAYYYFVGCKSGTCAITGSPYLSILFGSFFGFFIVNSPCSKGKC